MAVTFEVVVKGLVNLFFLAVLASLFVGCGKDEKGKEARAKSPVSSKSPSAAAAPAVAPEEVKVNGECKLCGKGPYLAVWCGFDGKNVYHPEGSEEQARKFLDGYSGRCWSLGYYPYSSDCHCKR